MMKAFAFGVLTSLQLAAALVCPVVDLGVSLCAMCSETDAAVRWSVHLPKMKYFQLKYQCRDRNSGKVYQEQDDTCFEDHPITKFTEDFITGVSGVGRSLSVGSECNFTARYFNSRVPLESKNSCSIKSGEVCAATPEVCHVDRMSEMDEDGQCQYTCAVGFGGALCNNIDECADAHSCDKNADCVDTDGSYWCQCHPGYIGDGHNCIVQYNNVDVCRNVTCGENAKCVANEGSSSCQCKSQFTGDGYNCRARSSAVDTSLSATLIAFSVVWYGGWFYQNYGYG